MHAENRSAVSFALEVPLACSPPERFSHAVPSRGAAQHLFHGFCLDETLDCPVNHCIDAFLHRKFIFDHLLGEDCCGLENLKLNGGSPKRSTAGNRFDLISFWTA